MNFSQLVVDATKSLASIPRWLRQAQMTSRAPSFVTNSRKIMYYQQAQIEALQRALNAVYLKLDGVPANLSLQQPHCGDEPDETEDEALLAAEQSPTGTIVPLDLRALSQLALAAKYMHLRRDDLSNNRLSLLRVSSDNLATLLDALDLVDLTFTEQQLKVMAETGRLA